jgi:hypothetical protein
MSIGLAVKTLNVVKAPYGPLLSVVVEQSTKEDVVGRPNFTARLLESKKRLHFTV